MRDDDVELQERFLLLCRAVQTLPPQCRRAFLLKKVYGLSRKEIASYMGIAESTVQKHIAKGMMLCAVFVESVEARAPSLPNLGFPLGDVDLELLGQAT